MIEYIIIRPVEIRFKDRRSNVDAIIHAGDSKPLFGAIPMEDIDIIIHPQKQELLVNPEHPYFAQMSLKGIR